MKRITYGQGFVTSTRKTQGASARVEALAESLPNWLKLSEENKPQSRQKVGTDMADVDARTEIEQQRTAIAEALLLLQGNLKLLAELGADAGDLLKTKTWQAQESDGSTVVCIKLLNVSLAPDGKLEMIAQAAG